MKTRTNILLTAAVAMVVFSGSVHASEDILAMMLKLGSNTHAEPLDPAKKPANQWDWEHTVVDELRLDEKVWRDVTEAMAAKGYNMVVIGLAEGVVYPSHPELAVKGSWSVEKLKAELARLRKLGLEPIPKLNFAASHDTWLKEYHRMVSTKRYYEVCADVIRDTVEIFGHPRFLHLGYDEEMPVAQEKSAYMVVRQGELWWHDFEFFRKEVEKHGVRAWIWSDYVWHHREEYLKRMPKSVLQSNWYYRTDFGETICDREKMEKKIMSAPWPEYVAGPSAYLDLEAAGYDQLPCGSIWADDANMAALVGFCRRRIPQERLKGFLMAPWLATLESNRKRLMDAVEIGARAFDSTGPAPAVAAAASVQVVPAHQFDAGGWKLDAQFLDVIGAPYLLAHGLGNRVPDASAAVEVPNDGDYRLWAYTRNWADGAPGRFKVAVDGAVQPTEFGTGASAWGWVSGDVVSLKKGTAVLSLKDLKGFDGRCAGLALTRGDARPEGAPDPRALPVAETRAAEFVVVGGGLPGTCAAVAAARRGVKTVLVQDRPVLGGNASAEVRVWCAGEARYDLIRELRGTFFNMQDTVALSDARRMGIVLNEPNLTVLLSTRVFAAEKATDGAITAVKAFDLKRGRVVRISAPLFCDATGDGWLGFYAGADFRMGREARTEFDEPADFAPEKGDGDTLGASLMWTSADGNAPVAFSAPWAEPHAQGEVKVNGEWNWEYGIHRDMIAEGEAIRDRLLLAIYGSFSLAKKNPAYANRVLNFVPFVLGKRESRRLMGDWVYSGKDVCAKTPFEDAIAAGLWSIDLHYDTFKPGVDFLTTCRQPHVGRYWIPYRSIYSRNVPNLFMAGRCFSCTHVGLGGARVINTLSQLGCAAGEAAALCKKYALRPRGIYAEGHVREVQDALGGEFPGRSDPKTAGWTIVDDESDGVTFGKGWVKTHLANGEQIGDYAHFTGGGAWGPSPAAVPSCGEAVYPLPVPKAGRYALMGRVPYLRQTPDGSSTAFVLTTGGRKREFSFNQVIGSGTWQKLGTFELEPGATLTIVPRESRGHVAADAFAIEFLGK